MLQRIIKPACLAMALAATASLGACGSDAPRPMTTTTEQTTTRQLVPVTVQGPTTTTTTTRQQSVP